MKKLSLLIISLITLLSCNNPSDHNDPVYAEIEVELLGEAMGRNEINNVGLYVVESMESQIDNPLINNDEIELQGSRLIIPSFDGQNEGTDYDLYIYSPYSVHRLVDKTYYNYELETDQQNVDSHLKNDFLYSKVSSVSSNKAKYKESFRHLMGQVEVIVDFAGKVELNNFSVELCDFATNVDVNMMTGELANHSGVSNIKPYIGNDDVDDDAISGITAIVIPQKKLGGELLCRISTDQFAKEIILDEDIECVQGKKTIITVKIDKSVTISTSIVEWDDSSSDGQVIKPVSDLYDIDGNKYNVIAIGDLYWTASNLITTRLNDGTPIVEGKETKEWVSSDYIKGEPRYCYLLNDATNKATRGVLYNWLTVKTDKICPRGWSVPSQDQWLKMRDYLGGQYEAGGKLKSTSGWEDRDGGSLPMYQGTNSVGFNAIPASYRSISGNFDHYASGYGANSITGWWSSTYVDVRVRGYCYSIVYGLNNLEEDSAPIDYGYSIRCIRSIK